MLPFADAPDVTIAKVPHFPVLAGCLRSYNSRHELCRPYGPIEDTLRVSYHVAIRLYHQFANNSLRTDPIVGASTVDGRP